MQQIRQRDEQYAAIRVIHSNWLMASRPSSFISSIHSMSSIIASSGLASETCTLIELWELRDTAFPGSQNNGLWNSSEGSSKIVTDSLNPASYHVPSIRSSLQKERYRHQASTQRQCVGAFWSIQ